MEYDGRLWGWFWRRNCDSGLAAEMEEVIFREKGKACTQE